MPKKTSTIKTSDIGRTYHDEVTCQAGHLTKGRPFRVHGIRAKFVFLRWAVTDTDNWIEAKAPNGAFRAFPCEAVSKVLPMPRGEQ